MADETNFSNFFYNKVYSFTFLGILDKGDFYLLTPFMKIAFFLGREYALYKQCLYDDILPRLTEDRVRLWLDKITNNLKNLNII